MPALTNTKRELFCQQIIEGAKFSRTQGDAYVRAGYRASGHSAETNASRLLKNADIQRRLAELGGKGARKATATAAALIDKLEVVYEGATKAEQYSAASRAVEVQGKLSGALVERMEIGGAGAFDGCEAPADVAERLLCDMDTQTALDTLDVLRAAVLDRAAGQALDVTPADPAPRAYRQGVEVEAMREAMLPKRRERRRTTTE